VSILCFAIPNMDENNLGGVGPGKY